VTNLNVDVSCGATALPLFGWCVVLDNWYNSHPYPSFDRGLGRISHILQGF
jgi:hypothetical protein